MPTDFGSPSNLEPTPYLELTRDDWAGLRAHTPLTLSAQDVIRLTGLGDRIDLREVAEIYLPLARLVQLYVRAAGQLHQVTGEFLGQQRPRVPFVIGIAGSVAVGKSTTARVLRELLATGPDQPTVQLVTTDGFLLPNAQLAQRGLLARKGFPESYNRRALVQFMARIKAGEASVLAPRYSHLSYDVIPGEFTTVDQPDILIVEGLNVLQPARPDSQGRTGLAVSDFFDFSLYVDAKIRHIRQWYIERFLSLREIAFSDHESYFHRYATLSDQAAAQVATEIWTATNEPNLRSNVRPTRSRATLVLTKGADHEVTRIRLRKI